MKHSTLLLVSALIAISGCGKYEKNPVNDLEEMRRHGSTEKNRGFDKPEVREVKVPVVQEKEVKVEQATVNQSFLVINPDADMTFVEGKAGAFPIRALIAIPGAKMTLVAQGLVDNGMKLVDLREKQKDTFSLQWTPPRGTVTDAVKLVRIKLIAKVTQAPEGKDKKTIEALTNEREITIIVIRDASPLSNVTVDGLTNEVAAGSLVPFSVTVKVPGVDDKSARTPDLAIYNDIESTGTELNLATAVVRSKTQKASEYLGDNNWKFSRTLDLRNLNVPAGTASIAGKFNMKVYSPTGLSSPETAKTVTVKFAAPVAPATPTAEPTPEKKPEQPKVAPAPQKTKPKVTPKTPAQEKPKATPTPAPKKGAKK